MTLNSWYLAYKRLLATTSSISAVSVPKKLVALHVQFPVSSGSAFSRTKWLPMNALPLVFFAQIISGLGVPWAEHWNCIASPFVAVYDFGGRVVMFGLAEKKIERMLTFYHFILACLGPWEITETHYEIIWPNRRNSLPHPYYLHCYFTRADTIKLATIMDNSLGTNLRFNLAFLHTRRARITTHQPNLSPHPTYNFEN